MPSDPGQLTGRVRIPWLLVIAAPLLLCLLCFSLFFCVPSLSLFLPPAGRTMVFIVSERLRWKGTVVDSRGRLPLLTLFLVSFYFVSDSLSLSLSSFLLQGFGTVAAVMWVATTSPPPQFLVSLSDCPSLSLLFLFSLSCSLRCLSFL